MNHLRNLWTTVRDYALDYQARKADVRELLEDIALKAVQLNVLFNFASARQRFVISMTGLLVLLLFAHSGNNLLVLLAIVLALLIIAGRGLFAFLVEDNPLGEDDENALESVELGGVSDGPEITQQSPSMYRLKSKSEADAIVDLLERARERLAQRAVENEKGDE